MAQFLDMFQFADVRAALPLQQQDKSLMKAVVENLLPQGKGTIWEIFGRLERRFAQRKGIFSIEDMELFLRNHPRIFDVEYNSRMRHRQSTPSVTLTTELSVCGLNSESGYCNGDCGDLHFCTFHLLSNNCPSQSQGRRCRSGHKLETFHNLSVLKAHDLDTLGFWQLQAIFLLPWVRRGVLCPSVCHLYNVKKGCAYGDSCTSLHICRPYVLGSCKFGKSCKRNHNIFDKQVCSVLDVYRINRKRKPKEILEELFSYECSGDDGDDDDDDDVSGYAGYGRM